MSLTPEMLEELRAEYLSDFEVYQAKRGKITETRQKVVTEVLENGELNEIAHQTIGDFQNLLENTFGDVPTAIYVHIREALTPLVEFIEEMATEHINGVISANSAGASDDTAVIKTRMDEVKEKFNSLYGALDQFGVTFNKEKLPSIGGGGRPVGSSKKDTAVKYQSTFHVDGNPVTEHRLSTLLVTVSAKCGGSKPNGAYGQREFMELLKATGYDGINEYAKDWNFTLPTGKVISNQVVKVSEAEEVNANA